MLRLTASLLAGLYATLVLWGDPPPGDVEVTRAAGAGAAFSGFGLTSAEAQTPPDASDDNLTVVDADEAVRLALAAGEAAAKPEATAAPVEATVTRATAEPAEFPVWYVTGDSVNLRAGPSTADPVVGQAALGDPAELLSDPDESWIRIRTADGAEAFIFGRYLAPEAPI